MKIQAEVSLYPLRISNLSKPIEGFLNALKHNELEIVSGSMSTRIKGDSDTIFAALRSAFTSVIDEYEVVMSVKMSNACPEKESGNYRSRINKDNL